MTFLYPEVLLLLVPAATVWWLLTDPGVPVKGLLAKVAAHLRQPGAVLRGVILTLLVLLASAPSLVIPRSGTDVVILVDRSLSMPGDSGPSIEEVIDLAEKERGAGDRVGVVTFGRRAAVETFPSERGSWQEWTKGIERDASDLAGGLEMALQLIAEDRAGKVLVLSDGEFVGPDPGPLAWEAAARDIPIDYRTYERAKPMDVAVESVDLPLVLQRGAAFQFSGWVSATHPVEVDYVLRRGETEITRGRSSLRTGRNRLLFRDRLFETGVTAYTLEVRAGDDRVPENDRGRGVTRVEGVGAILLVTHDGEAGNLGRALRATGRPVEVTAAGASPITMERLDRHAAVVFENVATTDLTHRDLATVARWVEDGGGGFLLTGGRRSFGIGGYHASPLDELLPVSMELRKEHRKLAVAIAVVLDRSGSMGMTVPSGQTKMELANQGTAAAIDLLSGMDEVAIIAVDSSAHVIEKLTRVTDRQALKRSALRIGAGGGGIFTYTGLVAGGQELVGATSGVRHIILFADAADAEEPGDYVDLLKKYSDAGITVSVIALGTEADPDADFLKDVARRGGGKIHFTVQPEALPRLFSLEAISVARSTFIEEPTKVEVSSDIRELGEIDLDGIPDVGGYNLTYLRERATRGGVTVDEYRAPLFAFWQRGLGRTAAFTAEADGKFTGPLGNWEHYDRFFATAADWLAGDDAPPLMAGRARRDGHRVSVVLELDPEQKDQWPSDIPELIALPEDPSRPIKRIPMTWEGEAELGAEYFLETGETWHHRIEVGRQVVRLNPVTLPYSPEFEPRSGLPAGRDVLTRLADRSGGVERIGVAEIFDHPKASARLVSLAPWLALLALLLGVFEIAARRLGLLTESLREGWDARRRRARSDDVPDSGDGVKLPTSGDVSDGESYDADEAAHLAAAARRDPLATLKEAKRRADRRR